MDLRTDHDAERNRSAADLELADRLSREARTSARWYSRYLFAFALASFVMAALFGVIGPRWGALVLTPVWLIVITSLSVWTQGQKTKMRGMTRSNTTMIIGWAIAWGVTVGVGTHFYPHTMWWWVLGGLAMATPPLLAAHHADKQTRA